MVQLRSNDCLINLNLNKYYKIYKNAHDMLENRGFKPLENFLTKKEWVSRYLGYLAELEDVSEETTAFDILDKLVLIFLKEKKRLLVYFHPFDSKLAQRDINSIHYLMKEKNTQHLIIVANNKATPKVSNVLKLLGHSAQLFSEEELLFNVTKCQLVPKHILVTGEERDMVLKKYGTLEDGKIHPDIFPAIFVTDPIIKYYNYNIDDLIRIERPRIDGFYDITYRIVTNPIIDEC